MSSLAHSQNKGLSKYQRTASQLQTHPSLHGGREEGLQQPEPEGKGLDHTFMRVFFVYLLLLNGEIWCERTENYYIMSGALHIT